MLDALYSLLTAFLTEYYNGNYGLSAAMFLVDLALIAVALLCLYGIAYLLFNRSTYSEEKTTNAKVVKISFVPEHGGTHVVPVFSGNGTFSTAITDDHEDEQDIVVVKSEDIGRLEIDNAELLESVEKGDLLSLTYQEKYTHWIWSPYEKTFSSYVPVKIKTKDGTEISV